ncbi:MAG TPA: hypothetical protein DCS93_15830 [Microscillaceae bacterium]|nr:hypothetical protein [Microscillaceae bacterium]
MKTPFPLSKAEQKAHQLWSKFTLENEESFWDKYDQLIIKKPVKFTTAEPPQQKSEQVAIQTQRFRPSGFSYPIRLVFLIGLLGLAAISISEAFSEDSRALTNFLPFAFILLFLARSIWFSYIVFKVSNKGLLVTYTLFPHRIIFIWEKIQQVELYKDEYRTTHISILLKSSDQYRYKYSLTDQDHTDFLEVLRHQGILVLNQDQI